MSYGGERVFIPRLYATGRPEDTRNLILKGVYSLKTNPALTTYQVAIGTDYW